LVAAGDGTLMISGDRAVTWWPIGPALPYLPDGLIYSPQRKAFFIWRGDCHDEVLPDAVMRLDFDPSAPVTVGAPST
jgi:hypothetical protein